MARPSGDDSPRSRGASLLDDMATMVSKRTVSRKAFRPDLHVIGDSQRHRKVCDSFAASPPPPPAPVQGAESRKRGRKPKGCLSICKMCNCKSDEPDPCWVMMRENAMGAEEAVDVGSAAESFVVTGYMCSWDDRPSRRHPGPQCGLDVHFW